MDDARWAGDARWASLRDKLVARIRERGPLRFGEYVDAALYDPTFGFFTRGGGAGRRSDFLTSPEVGPLFGAVIARALDTWWIELGRPDPFTFVDCGAGNGTLVRAVVDAAPRCLDALDVVLVERSPALRSLQPQGPRRQSRETLPDERITGVVLANELLDNLAFDLRQRTDDGWVDVVVDVDPVGALCDRPSGDRDRAAEHYAATDWLRRALEVVHRGRVVVIDYGITTEQMCERDWREWVRTYRDHARGGDPLSDPGTQDITVDVAFDQLTAIRVPTFDRPQHEFLRGHGIDELVAEGQKVWAQRAHLGDLAALKGRSRLRERDALCDPSGLGAFRVLEWANG
ncbi:MAG TPA: SAM-dependent methyltransferase [Acidimicrobiales bacterium]|nr:SAM-dependent methyltransferase [Acidimicrobiales bacterium]